MLLRCTIACRTNKYKALRHRHFFRQLDINKLWYLLKGAWETGKESAATWSLSLSVRCGLVSPLNHPVILSHPAVLIHLIHWQIMTCPLPLWYMWQQDETRELKAMSFHASKVHGHTLCAGCWGMTGNRTAFMELSLLGKTDNIQVKGKWLQIVLSA